MAILSKIRQRTVFLIFVIALALFSFVLMDVLSSGTFSSQKNANTVGTINGVDISREAFANQVDNIKQQMGGNVSDMQAVNFVWDRIVNSTLLENQMEELDITVSEPKKVDAMAQFFSQDSRFVDALGMFDYDGYLAFMKDAKKNNSMEFFQYTQMEKQLELNLKQETYLAMINAGMNASKLDGEFEYRSQNDRVNFSFVQIPYTSIPDESVPVSEQEIVNYIKNNPARFQSEASVDIHYVHFPGEASAEDEENLKNEIAALLEDQYIYNAATGQNDTIPGFGRTTDYVDFLTQFSDIPYNEQYVFKNQLPQEIADTLFTLPVGAVYGPFKFNNAYGLAKIADTRQMHDSIHVKHLLITWKDIQTQAEFRTKEEAKKLADSLYGLIQADGSRFEELAKSHSNDPEVASNGGDLGYIQPYTVVDKFNEFIIDNEAGTQGVVETEIGYHIISIEDKKNLQKVVKTPVILRAIEPSEATSELTFNQATTFEGNAAKDFLQAAAEHNYEVRPVNKIKQFDDVIPGIGTNRELVTWAFNSKTKVGAINRYAVGDGYIVVQLTARKEKGLMDAYEATAIVTPILRNQKKAENIRKSITGTTLEEIAKANNTVVNPAIGLSMASPNIVGIGQEPKVVGTALALKAGETSPLIDGAFGVYKLTVTKKEEASDIADYSTYVAQARAKLTANMTNRIIEALKKNAKIDDRRANFY